MRLEYKDFILERDSYHWILTQKKSYKKLDKLGGVETGEIGEKEEVIGYYPLRDFSIILSRLAELLVGDVSTIEGYITEYRNCIQELKELIDGITKNKD